MPTKPAHPPTECAFVGAREGSDRFQTGGGEVCAASPTLAYGALGALSPPFQHVP